MKRRAFTTGVAWSIPAVTLATAAPAFAASQAVLVPVVATIAGFSSEEPLEGATNGGRAIHAIDGSPTTFWHTKWSAPVATGPHHLIFSKAGATAFDLGRLTYLPRQGRGGSAAYEFANGTVTAYNISGANSLAGPWTQVTAGTFTWTGTDRSAKTVDLPQGTAYSYYRFQVTGAYQDTPTPTTSGTAYANAATITLSEWVSA